MLIRPMLPLALLIALQVLDVAVHVATNQIEPVRIASNLVLVGAAVLAVRSAHGGGRSLPIGVGLYLVLNGVFLMQEGLVNPSTDALRLPLFGFVILSACLAGWLRGVVFRRA